MTGIETMNGLEFLIDLNKKKSAEFIRDHEKRMQYRREHPTEIGVMKCMDGRVHFQAVTGMPAGVIQSWRNIGGKFDIRTWVRLQESLKKFWRCARKKNDRPLLWMVTDHFSRSNPHLGCKGHGYDMDKALASSRALKSQFDYVFGEDRGVFTIHVTMETDHDLLIFRGDGDDTLDLGNMAVASERDMLCSLWEIYPLMPEQIRKDLCHLAMLNLAHVGRVKESRKQQQAVDHNEWLLAVGQGYDWLHVPNTALIVGPFDPDFETAVEKAAGILLDNMKRGRFAVWVRGCSSWKTLRYVQGTDLDGSCASGNRGEDS
jgi:Carboxysome Shell Carbonic Anhydrase